MDNKVRLAILAGTEVDTQMGVNYFNEKGIKAVGSNISKDPSTTSALQILSPHKLKKIMVKNIRDLRAQYNSIEAACIYCNSLSTSVNLKKLKDEINIPIITPLETYRQIGRDYNNIGVLAANCQTTAGIENIIHTINESAQVIGIAALQLVLAIEEGMEPKKIISELSVDNGLKFMVSVGAEIIILGCTHFPYIEEEIKKISEVPIFSPSEQMYQNTVDKLPE